MFGEEDLVENKKRGYSMKCISPKGIVRIISKKNFIQRVLLDKTTQILIEKMIQTKKKWFSEKIGETQKVFEDNKKILTQNMSKDFILNNFLKNIQKKNNNVRDLSEHDKMKITRFFKLKSSLNYQSMEASKYPEEKEKFEKFKSEYEQKQFSLSPLKKKSLYFYFFLYFLSIVIFLKFFFIK